MSVFELDKGCGEDGRVFTSVCIVNVQVCIYMCVHM